MSTQENRQLVIDGYRLFQHGEIGKLLDLYHDDAEWSSPESELLPFAGAFHGKAGIAQFFTKLDASARVNSFEPAQFLADGDQVVAKGQSSWLAKPTGRSYDTAWVHVLTIRDHKIARIELYYDTAAAEKAFQPELSSQTALAAQLHH